MDYNDSDYEGHNLHLTGEESSKISSVLPPFALPKFDFDDSLHGNLRFDSLVENEVFLGISSQEDNQWIEEFSRGGNGIEFSSSAAESCALPRHINVWSEATSSESVEMLLKAVGQEEMVPGENMIEESDPVDQFGSSTRENEDNLRQDDKNDDVDYGNPSLSPVEVKGNFSRSNQSAGIEGIHSEYTLQTEDTQSSYGLDGKGSSLTVATENSNTDMNRAIDKQVETCCLMNEPLSIKVRGNLPILGREISNTGRYSQNVAVSGRESFHHVKISDISFSSCVAIDVSGLVEEQGEECKKNDGGLSGVATETDNTLRHISHEIPSKMETSKEEHAVEILSSEFGEISDILGKEKSLSTNDGCNEVPFADKPVGGRPPGTGVFSLGTEMQHRSEGPSTLHEKSSVSREGEGANGLGMHCSDVVIAIIDGNREPNQVPVIKPLDQHNSLVDNENICPGSNSSLETSHATSESSVLHEVHGNSSKKDDENNINPADGTGEFCEEKLVMHDMRDAGATTVTLKEIMNGGDHLPPPLIAESIKECTKDTTSIQVDAHQSGLGVSALENEDKKLPLDPSDMVCGDNEKEAESTFSNLVNVEKTTVSQLNSSARDYPELKAGGEDAMLTSSGMECDKLVECHKCGPPSCDSGYGDQIKGSESEAPKQPSTSVSKESLGTNGLSPAIEIEKDLDPVVKETKIGDQYMSLVENSSVMIPDEAFIKVNKMMERSSDDWKVQDNGAEAASTEKPMEAEEKNGGANSSAVSVIGCTAEIDKFNQATEPGASCSDLTQSEINKQVSLDRNNVENSGEVGTTPKILGLNDSSKEQETFTSGITCLEGHSTGDSGKCFQSFPGTEACKLSSTGEGSPSTFDSSQTAAMIVTGSSRVSSSTAGVSPLSEGPAEHKGRRGCSRSGKGSTKKGNQAIETSSLRQTRKGRKLSHILSPSGAGQRKTYESPLKPVGAVSIPTCSLPDLNTSAPPSAYFQQPFTDLQQVQLRAQIFVYGSLIQGTAPDEACMVSAFGICDGSSSVWELSWRTCVERLHNQKSLGNKSETPVPSCPDAGATPDQTNKQGSHQSDVISSFDGRTSNMAVHSPVVNPVIPPSSPLWSIATPSSEALPSSSMARSCVFDCQTVPPLSPYQTPPIRNHIAHSTGPSQAPFPVPWLAPSQASAIDISTNYPAFPAMDLLKVTSIKESSLPVISGTKHAPLLPATLSGAATMFTGTSSLDSIKTKVSTGLTADTKTRKRKKSAGGEDAVQISATDSLTNTVSAPVVANQLSNKAPAVENLSHISLIPQNQADLMPTPVISSHHSTPVAVATPSSSVPKGTTNQFFSVVPPSISTDHMRRVDLSIDKRALNIEGFGKVEEAKSQAEEAAAHAAAAIGQCEDVWSQVEQQTNSGLTSDTNSKLASAAVAIAAAASVAKAAAAAAKIASSAVVQAKHMADDALAKSGNVNITERDAIVDSNSMNMTNASPISILKRGNRNNAPSLAISAAREAARKRIEAASAATRHAENLDAIVRAAEIAAGAVSHVGKLVAMGDPLSLSELAFAGPDNYWKVLQSANRSASKPGDMNKNKSVSSNAGEVHIFMNQNEGPNEDVHVTNDLSPIQRDLSRNLVDNHVTGDKLIVPLRGESSFNPQEDKNEADSAKTAAGVSDPDVESRSNSVNITSIKEGSYVEVLKDRGDLRKAWFTATVLSLKDVEALVCYTDLKSDEGLEQLKEWISVEAKGGNAPKIRIPHPMTAMQFEGTRKRRRAAVKDYTWSVGDKVDAWVQDCWCEGIVADRDKKDATTLSVHFPAQGETLMVKLWHLRPTLCWSDGQWTEWCRPQQDGTSQGDTPVEKRTKLGSTSIETKWKGKMAKSLVSGETMRNEEPRLPLEKVFSIGSTKEESKPNMVRTVRSGLGKEGSRVVFGVPKPGKKRKFMEVSKHYVSDSSTKANMPDDSVKLAKFLASQGSGSRGLRNNSKLHVKERQAAESKPRATKSGKPPSIPRRTVAKKGNSTSSQPNARNADVSDHTVKGSASNDESESGEQNLTECNSNVEDTSGGPMVFSSQALPQENHKKAATRNSRSERVNQGKLVPANGKSAKNERKEKLISEAAEPRRSNRRIQPTYRLLEGLQTSMIPPSSLHDKSHTSQNKGTTRGNNSRS